MALLTSAGSGLPCHFLIREISEIFLPNAHAVYL